MAVVDPYAPCPCGSGEKFKWCCHKVEGYAERAERLHENGQIDAAIEALDEGLRKVPDNPWLSVRKAIIQTRQGDLPAAADLLRGVIRKHPHHVGAQGFLVRLILEIEGAPAGVAQLQQALSACRPEAWAGLAIPAQLVGTMLGDQGQVAAALAHLELARELSSVDDDGLIGSAIRMLEGSPVTSAWVRNPYRLTTAPAGLTGPLRGRFDKALADAREGLWSAAAAEFDRLASEGIGEAERNRGLTLLWQADDLGAITSLRRHVAGVGPTEDAVDLEALCQAVAPPSGSDRVAQVQWIWSLRDRDALLRALQADDRTVDDGRGSMDPTDPKSFEVDQFLLLDRPRPAADEVRSPADLPRVQARVLAGQEIVALEGFDDGRLDELAARFRDVVGPAIPPAHPRTKSVGRASRAALALQPDLWIPEGLDRHAMARLNRQERARIVREVWPETPMPYLNGRTPRQAAREGQSLTALRAAICQLELAHEFYREGIDFAAMRAELGVGDEPAIDPATVDVQAIHIGRLHRIPTDGLPDGPLTELFERAHRFVLPLAMEHVARAMAERPALLDAEPGRRVAVFGDLAHLALSRDEQGEAFTWLDRGRQADPRADQPEEAVRWDLHEVRLRSRTDRPEDWVPKLAVVLERYRDNQEANSTVLTTLLDMGLIQMAPHPDRPEAVLLDTRPLQAVLSRYGPKITTSTGELGVSASKGAIWTPGSEVGGGSSGGLWTPGGASSAGGQGQADKPRLLIPGR